MLELGSSGSVRGVLSNEHPYRHPGSILRVRQADPECPLFAHSCRSLVASERETIHLGFRGDRLQPSLEPTSKRRAMPAGRVRSAPPDDRKFELPTHCPTSQHFGPNKRANRLSNFARV
jgi:hypothetical protein